MSDQHDAALARQARVSSTFVELIDSLVEDFDVIELLTVLTTRSVELIDAAEAGILLADNTGRLRVMAASDGSPRCPGHVGERFTDVSFR